MSVSWKYFFIVFVFFVFSCADNHSLEAPIDKTKVTWSDPVAGIIYKNCTSCHRPGESGAFSLLSYTDAKNKANLIKFVTGTGYMPPWPADVDYTHFIGEKVLSAKEIELLKIWVEIGCPRGDSTKEPATPNFYRGSYFRKPDLVIKAPKPVLIKDNGTDVFLIMKYPYEIDKDTLIDFVEFVPHQRKIVHHVNGHLISYDENRKTNYQQGESVSSDTKAQLLDVYKNMHIPYTDGLQPQFPTLTPNTVYYLPGYVPPVYPENVGGYRMKKKGAFLLNNIHYGPSNLNISDSSYINVFYRKTPVSRPIKEMQLGTFGVSPIEPEFVIPPNMTKTFQTHYKIGNSISLLSVNPHMHLIGKSFWAFALKSNGDTVPLIKIKKWDFRWQYYYTYKHPLKLEAGSTIYVYGTFDNTKNNLNNPFHPPKTITQGNGVESMKTTEEMFQFIFTYLPYKNGDELIDLETPNSKK